uniref:Uncharacterized protein n=1 Tax=Dulem virus 224 TaxID=3145701 RepID=A0AAU8ATQ0_9VIRU
MESNRTIYELLNEIKSPFKANVIKENEKDQWIITCGELDVFPFRFETQDQAESFIDQMLPKGYEYMAMAAFIVKIVENYNLLNETKNENINR